VTTPSPAPPVVVECCCGMDQGMDRKALDRFTRDIWSGSITGTSSPRDASAGSCQAVQLARGRRPSLVRPTAASCGPGSTIERKFNVALHGSPPWKWSALGHGLYRPSLFCDKVSPPRARSDSRGRSAVTTRASARWPGGSPRRSATPAPLPPVATPEPADDPKPPEGPIDMRLRWIQAVAENGADALEAFEQWTARAST
jgi:hypothetical protein